MMTTTRQLAILEYSRLAHITKEIEALERKFLTECKKINTDKWFINIYFTRLLWITDELRDAYRHMLEIIIEKQRNGLHESDNPDGNGFSSNNSNVSKYER